MTTKKISKVIVYYEDGTYEEIKASLFDLQDKSDKTIISPGPVTQPYQPQWIKDPTKPDFWPNSPYTITCSTTNNVPLKYTITENTMNPLTSWSFTSANNFNEDKYTITSTSNGNVDLSK